MPMIMALIAYGRSGFFLAWAFAFPLGFGGIGIWFGFLVGLAAAVMLCVTLLPACPPRKDMAGAQPANSDQAAIGLKWRGRREYRAVRQCLRIEV